MSAQQRYLTNWFLGMECDFINSTVMARQFVEQLPAGSVPNVDISITRTGTNSSAIVGPTATKEGLWGDTKYKSRTSFFYYYFFWGTLFSRKLFLKKKTSILKTKPSQTKNKSG